MQGRFKRDNNASAEAESRGGIDRGSSPGRAQSAGSPSTDQNSNEPEEQGTGAPAKRPKSSGPSGGGSRIAMRNWRISTRLVSLLALPVVAATSLGALRIQTSMEDLDQLENMKLLTEMTKQATELASALQQERDLSAGPLASGNPKNDDVVYPREKTDLARDSFRKATQEIESSEDEALIGVNSSLVNILKQLEKLKQIRANAYSNDDYIAQTVSSYNELVTSLLSLSQDMAQATNNTDMIRATRALAAFSSTKEYASMQRAIISAGLAHSPHPKLSPSDRLYGESALLSEESALGQFTQIYSGNSSTEELLQALDDGGNPEIILADKYASDMLKDDSPIAKETRSYKDWYDQDSAKIDELGRIEQTLISEMTDKAGELQEEAQREALINGALILLVLGVSLVGAYIVARSMVRSLRRLQDTAQEVSQKRLPELVKQLSESDPQDVDTSVQSVGLHNRDEIGQVATAFDDVHREAVRLAAEQALLRGNVNAMFTNLSRRSQGLIQRQLSLISELESREADPDQLSSLFKLDHLATRMRRNGENLLVLAGEEPGRRWTRPVPLVDVLRAAASEVEQYERIELSGVPATEVAGRVVNDLVHLLAELLENATSFSSPQTKVKVTGHALPDGRVLVEIHDTGIGLSPEDLTAINERLASPPTVDVSVSRRMGLFVVGRLSQRHGIRIQLRPSDSGGTTALVMLPVDVAQGGRKPAGKPGQDGLKGQGSGAANLGPSSSTSSRLSGMTPRSQVTGDSRPALPARGAPGENQPGRTGSGLPTRPIPSGGAGAPGAGSLFGGPNGPGGQRGGQSETNIFGAGAPGPADRGGQGQPGTRPILRPRGQDPAGAPRNAGQQGPAAGALRPGGPAREQLPARGPAAELPGGPSHGRGPGEDTGSLPPGTSWGARRASEAEEWPTGGVAREAQRPPLDSPRGHEDVDFFPDAARGDGFPAQNAPEDTTQFARPDYGAPQQQSPGAPGQSGMEAGAGHAQETGAFPQPGGSDYRTPPPAAGGGLFAGAGSGPAQPPQERQETGEFSFPPVPRAPERPREPEPLPPAGPGDGRTPLFDSLESDWFRGRREPEGADDRTPAPPPAVARPSEQTSAAEPAVAPPAPLPQREAPRDSSNGSSTVTWRSSPNDELGRQAERVRQPAAGGVTTSGLPRRVPRANLVAGTAQQQTSQTGPQVSRAPDDVRGRLTNLRRGIQQGRRAGSGPATGHPGVGPTYQQER
ncbi:sensor histidine kinase [Streptomyces sp. TP-A0874]|uniref:sensor histidine kinase n=1 Tax=Streptomyces sp. TP-A0874 TaxID=549819 RepID=UPI00085308FD|nr:nitrate- and nitrite sensing domain-containing protein [Streptomyces sp. TP-A0874]